MFAHGQLLMPFPSPLSRPMSEWRLLCWRCWELLLRLPPGFRRGALWDWGRRVCQPALQERCHLPGLCQQLCVWVPTGLWWNPVWTQHPRMYWEVSLKTSLLWSSIICNSFFLDYVSCISWNDLMNDNYCDYFWNKCLIWNKTWCWTLRQFCSVL